MSDRQSLVSEIEFIQATRDTGYKSTGMALAELVDNAIQAGASEIRITVHEEKDENGRQITIAVQDNGHGMVPEVMQAALQFGGTQRFNDRNGLGRFGMGLPNSSVSQCRRVELYSWKEVGVVYFTYLDIDEIVGGELKQLPRPYTQPLPNWNKSDSTSSGTLVVWRKCDRLDYRKATTISQKLHDTLGRVFRHFLLKGTQLLINREPVLPVDPLFLQSNALLSGAEEFCPPLEYRVRALNDPGKIGRVTVRFSLLPIAEWHDWPSKKKRRYGIVGGAGVSIVRAGREIAYGWHFMGKKRRQNYDDWWRCEIQFEPILDEWFGVMHSKQGINPGQELKAFLSPDIEQIAHLLNGRVQAEFTRVRGPKRARSVLNAEQKDWFLPGLSAFTSNGSTEELENKRNGLQYEIEIQPTGAPEFFAWHLDDNELLVRLNEDHPFYEQVYQPIVEGKDERLLFYVECLLLSFARAEAQRFSEADSVDPALRIEWSHVLAALLS